MALGKECLMKTAAQRRRFRFVRTAICAALAACALFGSVACGGGKLFRKEKEPPKTLREWLAQERPK